MSCGLHVAHRCQLIRSVHPPAAKFNQHLRGGDDDGRPVDVVANAVFFFTASYFSTALLLALGADDLLASSASFVFLVFTRYLHFVNRAAYGVAGRLLAALGAFRRLLVRKPAPAPDNPAWRDRADDRDFFWNGHWLPL